VVPSELDASGVFGEDVLEGSVPAELDESGIFDESAVADEEQSQSGIFERSQLTNDDDEEEKEEEEENDAGDEQLGKVEEGDEHDLDMATPDEAIASGASGMLCGAAIVAAVFALAAWGLAAAGEAGLLPSAPDVGEGTAATADGASRALYGVASVAACLAATACVLAGAMQAGLLGGRAAATVAGQAAVAR